MLKQLRCFPHTGITPATPLHLIDKIIFSNWVALIAFLLDGVGFATNVAAHRSLMIDGNLLIFVVAIATVMLNARGFFLASRLLLISACFLVVTWMSLIQGKIEMMHLFFFPLTVVSFCMFHPSERAIISFFSIYAFIGYLFFDTQAEPIWPIDPMAKAYTQTDYFVNQLLVLSLFFLSLWRFLASYDSALKIVDSQRAQIFEQNRFNSLVRFAGGVAHEINNPLTIIHTRTSSLRKHIEAENFKAADFYNSLEVIENSTRRIADVVKSLAIFAREGRGESFTTTEVNDFISRAMRTIKDNILGDELPLNLDLTPKRHVVRINESNLWQVVMNVLFNAIDAAKRSAKPELWVSTSLNQDRIEIRIRDSGPGVSRDLESQIYLPFFTTKGVGQGAGLGLAVALSVVKEHQGDLKIDRNIGPSCFLISLPVTRLDGPLASGARVQTSVGKP